jgi:Tfp pilus assembly protein PilO
MPRNFEMKSMIPSAGAWKEPKVLVRVGLAVLLIANLAVAGYAFNVFGRSPEALQESLLATNAQLQAAKLKLNRSRLLTGNIGKAKADDETFLANYFTTRRIAFSTMLNEIDDIAKSAGMKRQEGTIAPLDPIEGTDDLSMMTISVNFEGTFPQLVKFVNLLDRSPRFLIIESMQVAPQPKGDIITSNFKLHVFVREDKQGAL